MLYVKALHIIFIVTWFSGLFYMVRLFIYAAEANDKPEPERTILLNQFKLMQKRLWFGITWPSAILTAVFGIWIWMWELKGVLPTWLALKLIFVLGLYIYHFSLHVIFRQQSRDVFRYSSQKLRVWNEVATIFLITIVMLATVKDLISIVWGGLGILVFSIVLMIAIKVYRKIREK